MNPFLNGHLHSRNNFLTSNHVSHNDLVTVDNLDDHLASSTFQLDKPLRYDPGKTYIEDGIIENRLSLVDTTINPVQMFLPPNEFNTGSVFTIIIKRHYYPLTIKVIESDTIYEDEKEMVLDNLYQHINFLSIGHGVWIIV